MTYFWQNLVASFKENASRVDRAIARSVSHNEIVTIDGDSDTIDELTRKADDVVRVRSGFWEFWGRDDEGSNWRVHVRSER